MAVFCRSAAIVPTGMPMASATISAAIPNWNETGSLSSTIDVTVWLGELSDGPKFIHRNATPSPKIGVWTLTK